MRHAHGGLAHRPGTGRMTEKQGVGVNLACFLLAAPELSFLVGFLLVDTPHRQLINTINKNTRLYVGWRGIGYEDIAKLHTVALATPSISLPPLQC